jgi:uncharacterized protein YjbI with pentapeptide repeats
MNRSLIISIALASLIAMGNPQTSEAGAENRSQMRILFAEADLDAGTLLIQGQSFTHANDNSAIVTLGDQSLVITALSDVEISATLLGGTTTGIFLLTVSRGQGPLQNDVIELRISSPLISHIGVDCTEPHTLPLGLDLHNCDLSLLDLFGASLTNADLIGANLTGSSLWFVDLDRADLDGANLTGTSLIGANLRGTDLSNADLTGADLTGADLTGADLSSADLTSVNLSNADLTGANLHGIDLSGVVWIDTVCPDGSLSSDSDGDGFTCLTNLEIP